MKPDAHFSAIHFTVTMNDTLTLCGLGYRRVACTTNVDRATSCPICKASLKDLKSTYEKIATKNRRSRGLQKEKP